jgi:Tol biopolymer transport system component
MPWEYTTQGVFDHMTAASKTYDFAQFENQTDIGANPQSGSCQYDPDQQVYTISAAGGRIGAVQDDFYFVWRRMTGNFILTMQAHFLGESGHSHTQLGWMARASLQPASPQVSAVLQADGLAALRFRRTLSASTGDLPATLRGADVIQLERRDNTFIMSIACFGEPFTVVQVSEINLGQSVYIGLFVCSPEPAVVAQASFRNVSIVVPVGAGFTLETNPFGSRLEILDVSNGQRQTVYSADSVIGAPNWTRDGQALIFNSAGRLYRLDLDTKTPLPIDTGEIIWNNHDHVFSFDGRMLAFSSLTGPGYHAQIYTIPAQGGAPTLVTPDGPSFVHGWSPSGKFLVYTGLRNGVFDIYRIPAKGGLEVQITNTPEMDDGPEYAPDGRYIYFNSIRTGRMQIWRMRPDGSRLKQLTDDEYNNWFPHVSPDGKQIIFMSYLVNEVEPGRHPAAKRVYLRTLPLSGGTPRVVAYLYGGQGTMHVHSWSPDSQKVAFVSNTVPYA